MGYKLFQGTDAGYTAPFVRSGPSVIPREHGSENKVVPSIAEALKLSGLKDGMTISFHHHFRDGDYVVNMVMVEIVKLGIKDITIAASSLGAAHDPVAEYIEQDIVTGLQTSGIR